MIFSIYVDVFFYFREAKQEKSPPSLDITQDMTAITRKLPMKSNETSYSYIEEDDGFINDIYDSTPVVSVQSHISAPLKSSKSPVKAAIPILAPSTSIVPSVFMNPLNCERF